MKASLTSIMASVCLAIPALAAATPAAPLNENDVVWRLPTQEQVEWAVTAEGRPVPRSGAMIRLDCLITETGSLTGCMALDVAAKDAPMIFWANRKAQIASVELLTCSGEPVSGRRIRFAVYFGED